MINFIKTLGQALYNLCYDLSIDIAGYIAYMSFLALFPFLIMLVSIAGYVGNTDAAQLMINEFYQVLPQEVVEAISPIIREVTEHPPTGILTIAIIGILWISSSGIEALRLGLNHAYGIAEKRSFYWRRFQSIFFVLIGSLSFLIATVILIILPILLKLWQYIEVYLAYVPDLPITLGIGADFLRLLSAYCAVLIGILMIYKWLPHHKVRFKACLPGALIASGLWIVLAGLFSLYLQNFARYDILYGSLGGMIVTLIFFHLSALLILYGAHVNKMIKE